MQLQRRADLFAWTRHWFHQRNILEVDVAALNLWANTDPNIDSLRVVQGGFLHTSPEFGMKRLLAQGSGDIYQMSHVFRAEEAGRLHRKEFMMLEWYRLNLDHKQLMIETLTFIQEALQTVNLKLAVEHYSYQSLFEQFASVNPFEISDQQLQKLATQHGLVQSTSDRDQLLDFIFAVVIQKQLSTTTLYTIDAFPSSQAALSRILPDKPQCCARFEILIGDLEIANGYHELLEGQLYRERFEAELSKRDDPLPMDESLCALLEKQPLPDCAGVALGMDRLLMIMMNETDIAHVLPENLNIKGIP